MAERTITLDGFSKTFAMTGWRLGYGIVPPSGWCRRSAADHQQRVVHQRFAQAAPIEALTGPQDGCTRCDEFIAPARAHGRRAERDPG
jgi:aspartate aminotransferase